MEIRPMKKDTQKGVARAMRKTIWPSAWANSIVFMQETTAGASGCILWRGATVDGEGIIRVGFVRIPPRYASYIRDLGKFRGMIVPNCHAHCINPLHMGEVEDNPHNRELMRLWEKSIGRITHPDMVLNSHTPHQPPVVIPFRPQFQPLLISGRAYHRVIFLK